MMGWRLGARGRSSPRTADTMTATTRRRADAVRYALCSACLASVAASGNSGAEEKYYAVGPPS